MTDPWLEPKSYVQEDAARRARAYAINAQAVDERLQIVNNTVAEVEKINNSLASSVVLNDTDNNILNGYKTKMVNLSSAINSNLANSTVMDGKSKNLTLAVAINELNSFSKEMSGDLEFTNALAQASFVTTKRAEISNDKSLDSAHLMDNLNELNLSTLEYNNARLEDSKLPTEKRRLLKVQPSIVPPAITVEEWKSMYNFASTITTQDLLIKSIEAGGAQSLLDMIASNNLSTQVDPSKITPDLIRAGVFNEGVFVASAVANLNPQQLVALTTTFKNKPATKMAVDLLYNINPAVQARKSYEENYDIRTLTLEYNEASSPAEIKALDSMYLGKIMEVNKSIKYDQTSGLFGIANTKGEVDYLLNTEKLDKLAILAAYRRSISSNPLHAILNIDVANKTSISTKDESSSKTTTGGQTLVSQILRSGKITVLEPQQLFEDTYNASVLANDQLNMLFGAIGPKDNKGKPILSGGDLTRDKINSIVKDWNETYPNGYTYEFPASVKGGPMETRTLSPKDLARMADTMFDNYVLVKNQLSHQTEIASNALSERGKIDIVSKANLREFKQEPGMSSYTDANGIKYTGLTMDLNESNINAGRVVLTDSNNKRHIVITPKAEDIYNEFNQTSTRNIIEVRGLQENASYFPSIARSIANSDVPLDPISCFVYGLPNKQTRTGALITDIKEGARAVWSAVTGNSAADNISLTSMNEFYSNNVGLTREVKTSNVPVPLVAIDSKGGVVVIKGAMDNTMVALANATWIIKGDNNTLYKTTDIYKSTLTDTQAKNTNAVSPKAMINLLKQYNETDGLVFTTEEVPTYRSVKGSDGKSTAEGTTSTIAILRVNGVEYQTPLDEILVNVGSFPGLDNSQIDITIPLGSKTSVEKQIQGQLTAVINKNNVGYTILGQATSPMNPNSQKRYPILYHGFNTIEKLGTINNISIEIDAISYNNVVAKGYGPVTIEGESFFTTRSKPNQLFYTKPIQVSDLIIQK